MNFSIRGLLLLLICSACLVYWLPPSWFAIAELIGIAALIGSAVLPLQDQVTWLRSLRTSLFWIGGGLTLLSPFAASYAGFNFFVAWIVVISLWSVLSLAVLELSGSFNSLQMGVLLYITVAIGLGLGYLGITYLNF